MLSVLVAALFAVLAFDTAADADDATSVPAAPVSFPFDVGDVPAGETLVIEFQASVPAAPVPAGVESVSNQGTVSGTGVADVQTDDPDTAAANDATVTLIAAAPDLAVVKTVTDILDDAGVTTGQTAVVRPGGTIVYQLAYQNKASATQIAIGILGDTVPVDTTFDAANSTAGWTCPDNSIAGVRCSLDVGALSPGNSGTAAFALTVLDTGLSGAANISNTGVILLPDDDPIPADNASTVSTPLRIEADIAVTKVVDQMMPIRGEQVVFTVTATNNGPEPATNVLINDALPSGLDFDDAVESQGTYVSATGIWTLEDPIAVGANATLMITATVNPGVGDPLMITNVASVRSLDQTDPTAGNDSDSATIEHKAGDYGDAPDPLTATAGELPTLLANDGARHAIPNTGAVLFLGAAIDADVDGQPNATATGDDTDGEGDDEDGVTYDALIEGLPVEITVVASAAGLLNAWIDFNNDGVWADNEQVFTDEPVVAGSQSLTSTVSVPTPGSEGDRFARVRLSTAGGLAPTGRADDGEVEDNQVTILGPAAFSVDDPMVLEGDAGTTQLIFTVSRSFNVTDASVTATVTAGTATAGTDFTLPAPQVLSFPLGGVLSQQVVVDVSADTLVELDETVLLTLSAAVNAGIADGDGVGTITNDDSAIVSIDDVSMVEGDAGITDFVFTVGLSNPVDAAVGISFQVVGDTAMAGIDFAKQEGFLTFPAAGPIPGSQTQTIEADVFGEALVELDETFEALLFNLSAAGRDVTFEGGEGSEIGVGTIENDDAATLTIDDVSMDEGDTGDTTVFTFTVSLDAEVDVDVDIDFATADDSATIADNDYTATSGMLTFSAAPLPGAGESQTIMVDVIGDDDGEGDERFFVDLTNLMAGGRDVTFASSVGEGTIVDDDDAIPPTITQVDVVGAGELTTCRTVLGDVSQLAVMFDEPMANAEDPLQYRLIAAGPDGDLDPTACGAMPIGDDREVAILAAVSDGDPITPTITLDLAGAQRTSDAYRLLVCGTLTDIAGNALDGGNGEGSDFDRLFRIDRFNQFMNGHFDDCDPADVAPIQAEGWDLTPPAVVAPSRDDADDAGISGSLLADVTSDEIASAAQTVPVMGGQRYTLRSRYRFQLDGGLRVDFAQGCVFFDQPGGAGIALEATQDILALEASNADWQSRSTDLMAPASAQSARCAFSAVGIPDGATTPMFQLFVDDLSLDIDLFGDGFESGDTSSWSAAVPGSTP